MNRTRVADDFTTIRARMEELRRNRVGTKPANEHRASRVEPIRGGRIRPVEIAIRQLRRAAR